MPLAFAALKSASSFFCVRAPMLTWLSALQPMNYFSTASASSVEWSVEFCQWTTASTKSMFSDECSFSAYALSMSWPAFVL